MFVMESIDHVLANACKSVLIYVQYDDDRVNTDATRRNMQSCITWGGKFKRGQRLWKQRRSMWVFLVRGLLHLSKLVLPV